MFDSWWMQIDHTNRKRVYRIKDSSVFWNAKWIILNSNFYRIVRCFNKFFNGYIPSNFNLEIIKLIIFAKAYCWFLCNSWSIASDNPLACYNNIISDSDVILWYATIEYSGIFFYSNYCMCFYHPFHEIWRFDVLT